MMTLTDAIKNALQLLQRVTVQGSEVPAFVETCQALNEALATDAETRSRPSEN